MSNLEAAKKIGLPILIVTQREHDTLIEYFGYNGKKVWETAQITSLNIKEDV